MCNNDMVKGSKGTDSGSDYEKKHVTHTPFTISYNFFSKGICKYINPLNKEVSDGLLSSLDVDSQIKKCSTIFKDIATIPICDKECQKNVIKSNGITILNDKNCLGDVILDMILHGVKGSSKFILEIRSPIGSYKNRLLQYIYLKIYQDYKEILPFYIDMSKFEKEDKKKAENDFNSYLSILKKILGEFEHSCPLIIIDNVRLFQCGINGFYDKIKKELQSLNIKIIVGSDRLFTINEESRIKNYDKPFGEKQLNIINISSLSLSRENECLSYIKNCIDFFIDNNEYKESDYKKIYKLLINIGFYDLDAYLSTSAV